MGDIDGRMTGSHLPKVFGRTLFALWVGMASLQAWAEPAPDQVIQQAVDQLRGEFALRRSELEGDRPALFRMVDRITHPYFDFNRISKLVLAQNWKAASAEQRRDFGEEFRKLLIRTYATALFQSTGEETIAINGARIKERGGMKFATVDSEIQLSDGPPVQLKYSMILDSDSQWKIYNMTVAGLNLVTNYRKIYGASVRKQGLDDLIRSMRDSNHVNQPG